MKYGLSKRFGEYLSSSTPVSVVDENATWNEEGDSLVGWTTSANATSGISGGVARITKNSGTNATLSKAVVLPTTGKDQLFYGKLRASNVSTDAWAIQLVNGSQVMIVWLGRDSTGANTAGTVSVVGYTGAQNKVDVLTGAAYQTTFVEFCLEFNSDYGTLAFFLRGVDGKWDFKGRVAHTAFSAANLEISCGSTTAVGGWCEFDYLTFCKPNLVAIGDSICAGSTGYNPNISLGLSNYNSTWQKHCTILPSTRNSLIVNKGIGGQKSGEILSRVSTYVADTGCRVCFLHMSTNDATTAWISFSDRLSNIQQSIDQINAAGARCIVLGSIYSNTNNSLPETYSYYLNFARNWVGKLNGYFQYVEIMDVLKDSSGRLNPTYGQADGIHPNITGYTLIGQQVTSVLS